jgi:hypothetical protein
MIRWIATTALAALAAAPQEQLFSNSYKGKAPPDLVSEKGDWINSDKALKLADLKGKPVWIEFSFIN